jgi:hypothetical protein
MNVCSLSGRLTWPPELRYQANGKPELSLRLSVRFALKHTGVRARQS